MGARFPRCKEGGCGGKRRGAWIISNVLGAGYVLHLFKPNPNLDLLSIFLKSKHPRPGTQKRCIQKATTARAKRASLGQVTQKAREIEVSECYTLYSKKKRIRSGIGLGKKKKKKGEKKERDQDWASKFSV